MTKFANKSFSVGGYSKAYADNWDKTFKRKSISLPDPDAYRCACGLHKVRGRLEWVDCAKHRSPSDDELLAVSPEPPEPPRKQLPDHGENPEED